MLHWAVFLFFVAAIIAVVFGFEGIAASATAIAQGDAFCFDFEGFESSSAAEF